MPYKSNSIIAQTSKNMKRTKAIGKAVKTTQLLSKKNDGVANTSALKKKLLKNFRSINQLRFGTRNVSKPSEINTYFPPDNFLNAYEKDGNIYRWGPKNKRNARAKKKANENNQAQKFEEELRKLQSEQENKIKAEKNKANKLAKQQSEMRAEKERIKNKAKANAKAEKERIQIEENAKAEKERMQREENARELERLIKFIRATNNEYTRLDKKFSNNVFKNNINNVNFSGEIQGLSGPLKVRPLPGKSPDTLLVKNSNNRNGIVLLGFVNPQTNKFIGKKSKEPHISVPLRQSRVYSTHSTKQIGKHLFLRDRRKKNGKNETGKQLYKNINDKLPNGHKELATLRNHSGLNKVVSVLQARQKNINRNEIIRKIQSQVKK